MKLRTALGELKVTNHVEGRGVDLESEVIAIPREGIAPSVPEMVRLVPKGNCPEDDDYQGITLEYVGQSLPDVVSRIPERFVLVATDVSWEELESSFSLLPKLHVYLDLQRKKLFNAFQTSYDIQRFADKACEILGNPLMIINSDRRLLASAGEFPENRADVLEEINQGYVSEEVNVELEAAGILDDVRHAGHSIISENERFGQRWVTSVISFHHMEMGRFDMLELNRTVRDSDLELIDFAGSLAAILIDKLGVAGKRAGSGSSVLDDILSNSLANEKTMRAQLALSSMPLDDTYTIIQLAGDRDIPRAHLQRIASRVGNAFRNSLWTLNDNKLVVMVALGQRTTAGWDAYGRAERVLGQRKEFVNTLERNGLHAYVCEPFEQLGLASARFDQIAALSSVVTVVTPDQPIVYFWHHRYEVITSIAQTFGEIDMMLDKRVVAMSLYDQEHGTAYLETACCTVDFPGSPAEAAKALNVHRNTYFYRVNKIMELFFLNLRNGEDRLAVAFSTRMLKGMGGTVLYDVDHMPEAWRRSVGRRH
ncbi:MAG: helix-turn-helix domain-containing protein [Atopobiaceae bacterium]|nr:helix-turn-helix domain-containing protein [Atopobiaceae bacterium]